MAEIKSLSARIAAISNEIGAIAKDGRNSQQGYAFIEYAQVAARARELQAKHGVAIVPTVESYECTEVRNKFGSIGYHYLLDMSFTVINTDDPEDKMTVKWISEATDYGDKGINKAITSGVKYFIMRLYNISEKGEREADQDTPPPAVDPKPKAPNKPKIDQGFLCKVRGALPLINTEAELEEYWKKLKLNKQYQGYLQPAFKTRREELKDGVQ